MIIQNARLPPAKIIPVYIYHSPDYYNEYYRIPFSSLTVWIPSANEMKNALLKIVTKPSTMAEITNKMMACAGAKKKMEAKGFVKPILSLRSNTSVKDHRKPPSAEAHMTCVNLKFAIVYNMLNNSIFYNFFFYPTQANSVSFDTISTTPAVMMTMININFQLGFSNLKIKANINTKASVEDLHMAVKKRAS
jgi:hypothetical protein